MELKIQHVSCSKNQRIIVMSDLHGAYSLFEKALHQVQFTTEDICIIVGDICEKGESSLGLIRKIMELQKNHSIYCVMGNCDTLFEDIYQDNEENNEEIKQYMLWRKQSLLNEMCQETGFDVSETMDVSTMKQQLRASFKQEFDFLANLAHIIETEHYIFVHAGITSQALYEQDPLTCLTLPTFMNQDVKFEKTVIVGHWPVCNYNQQQCSCHVRFDSHKNILGIDGGNGVKLGGQVNVVVFEEGKMTSFGLDAFPQVKALDYQQASEKSYHLTFPYTVCEILEKNETESLCYLKAYDLTKSFKNEELYQRKNVWYCKDEIIHDLEIHENENISLITKEKNQYLVKKNGIIGWYHGRIEGEANESN